MTTLPTTIHEPGRDLPIRHRVDVVVCGGGAAGAVAALAAAAAGASVAVVDPHGFLGGANTAAQVNGVGGWQFDLDGNPLISGLPLAIMARIARLGGADAAQVERLRQPVPKPNYRDGGLGCFWIRTSPEHTKLALDEMMREAGVHVLLHASAVAPLLEGPHARGVIIESKSGREAILAKVVVDCTGDGDIAARAGAPFAIGRPEDGACQPMSLIFTVGQAEVPPLWYGPAAQDPETDPLRRGRFAGAIRLARERGEFLINPNDLLCAATPLQENDPAVRAVNFTRIQGRDATDAAALTQAEIEGRLQAHEAVAFMRKYVPGCAGAYLVSTAPQIGIRESRRILGDHVLTGNEVRQGADFDDTIARGIYLLDIHNPTDYGKPSTLVLLDAPYSMPYRCLLPRGIDGLLVAGRCISGDHLALASFRVQSHAMALGQAAGAAAALAARNNQTPRQLDVKLLLQELRRQGANLGPTS
jgi:2-polyprenyl-6-methoxyphenol hydroxylase-like FAD-dependent oxidoreductase